MNLENILFDNIRPSIVVEENILIEYFICASVHNNQGGWV